MLNLLRLSIGVVLGLMLWTAMAHGQTRPACDPQGTLKTPATVASPETLKDLEMGGRVEATLREAPSC